MKNLRILLLAAIAVVSSSCVIKAEQDVALHLAQEFKRLMNKCEEMSEKDVFRDTIMLIGDKKADAVIDAYFSERNSIRIKSIAYHDVPGCRNLSSMMNEVIVELVLNRNKKNLSNEVVVDVVGSEFLIGLYPQPDFVPVRY